MYLTSWEEKGFIRNENNDIEEGKVKSVGKDILLMLLIS